MHNKLTIVILFFNLYFVNCTYSQVENSTLQNYLEKKREYNKANKTGYSLLLYNGDEENALSIYDSFSKEFKNIEVKLTYVSPNWKVVTRTYSSKIEAERIYLMIKNKHPNAKIL